MDVDPVFTTNIKHRRSNTSKGDKRTIKYLATCTDPRAYSAVARAAPDSTIRAISNAALNIEQGDIHLPPKLKTLFRKHRKHISTLSSASTSLARKRKVIQSQKGGFFFIPALLGAALGAVGGKIVSALFGGQQQPAQQ
jgi:aspartate carbamoyltransferase regulatory subunit